MGNVSMKLLNLFDQLVPVPGELRLPCQSSLQPGKLFPGFPGSGYFQLKTA